MAFFSPLGDREEQVTNETLIQLAEKVECLSQAPLVTGHRRLSNRTIQPFKGYHEFRLKIPAPKQPDAYLTTTNYQLIEPSSSTDFPQVCVPRSRAWPITVAFRPSVTPLNWWLRITPVFVDAERIGDIVERCRKHQTRPSSAPCLSDLSFVEVRNESVQYTKGGSLSVCSREQICVSFPLDVIELYGQKRAHESEKELSQDQNSQSVLLPEVRKTFLCVIHCYNSCLGIGLKGEIDLLVTLEFLRSDSPFSSEFEIAGLQKVRVRCCACPSRDAREVRGARPRPAEPAGVNESGTVRKIPRCLSLSISSRRNIRAVRTHQSSESAERANSSLDLPPTEVTIGARKYFLLLTDDPLDYSRLREFRNVYSHSNDRWSTRSTRPDLKQIDRAFARRELYVARRYARNAVTRSQNSSFGESTQSSLNQSLNTDPEPANSVAGSSPSVVPHL